MFCRPRFSCYQYCNYLATLSNHLSIPSMVNIEMRHATTKTVHVAVIDMLV